MPAPATASRASAAPLPASATASRASAPFVPRPARAAEQRDRPRAGDPARDGPYGDLRRAGTAPEVVRELLVRRAAELGATGAEHPTTTVPGSPAAAVDAAEWRSLAAAGLSYRRLRLSAREVSVRSASRTRAVVQVTADTSGYDVVDQAGRVRSRVPPRPAERVLLHLVLTDQGWRVAAVTAP